MISDCSNPWDILTGSKSRFQLMVFTTTAHAHYHQTVSAHNYQMVSVLEADLLAQQRLQAPNQDLETKCKNLGILFFKGDHNIYI